MFIGGVYLAPPLLTLLVVVGSAFTFDPSLVVIGSYCGVAFIDGNSEKRGRVVVFYTSVATNHALTSFHVVGIHFTLDPSSVYHALTPPFLFHFHFFTLHWYYHWYL